MSSNFKHSGDPYLSDEHFFSTKLYTHTIRTKKLNKKQLKIQWAQHFV